MKDFFKWWYTDSSGKEYMTFSECALRHDHVIIATVIVSVAVVVLYGVIAYKAYAAAKKYPRSLTKTYLLNMMTVFVFCALSGYGYTVLSVFYNPYKLRVLLLLILAIWSYRFYKSMVRTNIIDAILEKEKVVQQRIKNYNRMALRFQEETPQIITWDMLRGFNLHQLVLINRISFVKISETEHDMVFLTEMEFNSAFGKHLHDCIEEIVVLKGELIDDLNSIHLTKGQTYAYNENQLHEPYCNVESTYKVTFKKLS